MFEFVGRELTAELIRVLAQFERLSTTKHNLLTNGLGRDFTILHFAVAADVNQQII